MFITSLSKSKFSGGRYWRTMNQWLPKGRNRAEQGSDEEAQTDFLYNTLGQPCMRSPWSASIRIMAKENLSGYLKS